MNVRRIVSGGQTGVDRAALDVAIVRGLPHGGWCPRGRLAEDGSIPPHYQLRETPTSDYTERTEWNVRDTDGTLIVTRGEPTGGTRLTWCVARRSGRPCLVVDVAQPFDANGFCEWIARHGVRVLNVAGPRRSQWEQGYRSALLLLGRCLARLDDAHVASSTRAGRPDPATGARVVR